MILIYGLLITAQNVLTEAIETSVKDLLIPSRILPELLDLITSCTYISSSLILRILHTSVQLFAMLFT